MNTWPKYRAIEGNPPEPPELVEPDGVEAIPQIDGVDEINRKLDLIMQALHVEED